MTDRRHNVTVLDCTIRDGGLCNQWDFSHEFVANVYQALGDAGVDIMEIGYLAKEAAPGDGPWRMCAHDDLDKVVRLAKPGPKPKLSAMVDIGRSDVDKLPPKSESHLDIIRIAAYHAQVPEAVRIAEKVAKLGYQVFVNVMAVTKCTPQQVDCFLGELRSADVEHVAVVDSFGAMYPHQLRYLVRKYKNWLAPHQKVGVHLHNNQQTAFANTIAAIDEGADFVDATLFGMGRGAGNCPLELLLMYLDDPKQDVRPLWDLTPEFVRLRQRLHWGYQVPFGITGWLNTHPKAAIEALDKAPFDHAEFYDKLTEFRPTPGHHRALPEPS